jgi:hypothetical protein
VARSEPLRATAPNQAARTRDGLPETVRVAFDELIDAIDSLADTLEVASPDGPDME